MAEKKPTTMLKVYGADASLLVYSKIVWSEGCHPARIVMRKLENKYVTYMETLGLAGETFVHDGFHHGHYFDFDDAGEKNEAFAAAMADYKERAGKL